ncbi:MAG: ABC transporter ATP-binding protein, partial [Chloroflexi bacterium]|nr:ABC transporter ATP-binding protein [Chloroflexota bacterium]
MLTAQGLTKRFATAGEGAVMAMDGVSFEVPDGKIFTLLGPSGCGKSTTLRSIAGLETPDGGRIAIDDQAVFDAERRLNLPPDRRPIGMVFQSYAIWPHLTVGQNVAYPLEAKRTPRGEVRSRVADALRLVGLEALANRPAPLLSGGQQQRVALARALVGGPSLLLLDEPLSNLDAKLREQMRQEIRGVQRSLGLTAVYVTHDQEEALVLSDVVGVMHNGRLLETASPRDLYQRPRYRFTADFLGLANFVTGRKVEHDASRDTVLVDTPVGALRCHALDQVADEVTFFFRPEDARLRRGSGEGFPAI